MGRLNNLLLTLEMQDAKVVILKEDRIITQFVSVVLDLMLKNKS